MSKESKRRDRYDQLDSAGHDRPDTFCPGCGYYLTVNGEHRNDCTKTVERKQQ
jgi:hypothetical protein